MSPGALHGLAAGWIERSLVLVALVFLALSCGNTTTPAQHSESTAGVSADAPTGAESSTRPGEPEPTATPTTTPGRESARVVRVVGGDTIDVELGGATLRVRYIGVDTPETVDPRRPVGCFGQEASDVNKAPVDGMQVELEKDVSETNSFGRLLRYVYVGGAMVNETLLREGYAQSRRFRRM